MGIPPLILLHVSLLKCFFFKWFNNQEIIFGLITKKLSLSGLLWLFVLWLWYFAVIYTLQLCTQNITQRTIWITQMPAYTIADPPFKNLRIHAYYSWSKSFNISHYKLGWLLFFYHFCKFSTLIFITKNIYLSLLYYSTRKRMSVVVRTPDNKIKLLCKGAVSRYML